MPQVLKASKRARFLAAASQAFACHGFERASLRDIATHAGGSLGNLRNYFATKDALFRATCAPVPDDLERALDGLAQRAVPATQRELLRLDAASVQAVARYIADHRAQLDLLLHKSHGSSAETWGRDLLATYIALERERLDAIAARHPAWFLRRPSPQLVRGLCQMYFELAADFVAQRLDEDTFWEALAEYDAFRHAGLQAFVEARP